MLDSHVGTWPVLQESCLSLFCADPCKYRLHSVTLTALPRQQGLKGSTLRLHYYLSSPAILLLCLDSQARSLQLH